MSDYVIRSCKICGHVERADITTTKEAAKAVVTVKMNFHLMQVHNVEPKEEK